MGAEPSQQPPDWWNMSGPWIGRSRRISSSAAGVMATRDTVSPGSSGRASSACSADEDGTVIATSWGWAIVGPHTLASNVIHVTPARVVGGAAARGLCREPDVSAAIRG